MTVTSNLINIDKYLCLECFFQETYVIKVIEDEYKPKISKPIRLALTFVNLPRHLKKLGYTNQFFEYLPREQLKNRIEPPFECQWSKITDKFLLKPIYKPIYSSQSLLYIIILRIICLVNVNLIFCKFSGN